MVDELGPFEEAIDEPLAFVGTIILCECADLVRSRQATDDVDVRTSQEGEVVASSGRLNAEELELLPDELVDEALPRQLREDARVDLARKRDRDARGREATMVARHDRRLARKGTRLDETVLVDLGDRAFVRLERGEMRDVLLRAVGEPRRDDELLSRAGPHHPRYRRHADGLDGRRGSRRPCSSRSNPSLERSVERGVALESLAAAVRDLRRRFEEEQAAIGRRREESSSARVAHDGVVVELVVEAKERELKTALPTLLAVAGAGVAAPAREDGLHRLLERLGEVPIASIDLHAYA